MHEEGPYYSSPPNNICRHFRQKYLQREFQLSCSSQEEEFGRFRPSHVAESTPESKIINLNILITRNSNINRSWPERKRVKYQLVPLIFWKFKRIGTFRKTNSKQFPEKPHMNKLLCYCNEQFNNEVNDSVHEMNSSTIWQFFQTKGLLNFQWNTRNNLNHNAK